jgi:cbb3-type cytochrome oxidase cytochrome c subunit
VAEHFADPPKLSPNSEMPAYKFNQQDLAAITDYLMAIPK